MSCLKTMSQRVWINNNNKFIFTEKFIEHVEKNIYFRDVHLFLKRIKDVTKIKDVAQIRENLFTCLRELALQWYISELFENIKNFFRYDNEIKYWEKELLKKFKESVNVVMTSMIKKKYIMKNVKRRRESRKYAEIILRAAKSTKLISEINQIFLIYNDIDVKFQRNISMSKTNTKLNSFFTNLSDRKNVWWQLADSKRSSENFYDFFINSQEQYFYEFSKYDNDQSKYVNYQSEYQRFRNDRDESSRYSSYAESQRYDQIYDDNREYQFRDFSSNFSNYFNDADKINFNSNSFYLKSSSSQNDINRNQRSFLNTDQNVNDYTRSDSIRDTSFKNDSLSSIRLNWTSKSTFSLRSKEFDRRNDEYKNKIYNAEMKKQNLNQKYSQKDEYDEKYSQKNHNQKDMSINFV
jgi:hypothetical protein